MLSVHPQQFELPRDEISMDSAPALQEREPEMLNKQQEKKSMLSPYKILLALAVFFMLVMVSYKVYDYVAPTITDSEINSAHGKLIQHADSSSKDKASTSGSSSSKTSKNNDKPNTRSQPASKGPIGSSFGSSSEGDDEEDSNDEKKNG